MYGLVHADWGAARSCRLKAFQNGPTRIGGPVARLLCEPQARRWGKQG
jgi:hypothetical protein